MRDDLIKYSKEIYEELWTITEKLDRFRDYNIGYIRDNLMNDWMKRNEILHLYKSNDRLNSEFISDKILEIFCNATSQRELDDNLNYLLLKLCEAGYEIC
jgi:hypothetical protein